MRCLLAVLLCGLLACKKETPPDPPPEPPVTPMDCEGVRPGAAPLHRLTRVEYRNTIKDLLGVQTTATEFFSADEITGGFASNTVGVITELDQNNYLDAAEQIAAQAITRLPELLPCDPATGEDACIESFVRTFGKRAFRRPLSEEEVSALMMLNSGLKPDADLPTRVRLLLTAFLLSGNFLYRPEVSPEPDGMVGPSGEAVLLSDYEIASRLSYFLWQTMPDEALFSAADAGGLNTPEGIRAQTARMLQDDRAKATLIDFHEQWLRIGDIENQSKDLEAVDEPGMGETIALLTDGDPAWLDTQAGNSLNEDDALFLVDGDQIQTASPDINIHSHYRGAQSGTLSALTSFEYRGKMMISDPSGGIGITFLSDYPSSDRYYRLRRFGDGPFLMAPHGTVSCEGFVTPVIPAAGVWYSFKVVVEIDDQATRLQAKVWEDGQNEPDPQINCRDESAERLTRGTFGLWAMANGEKRWSSLEVLTEPSVSIQRPDFAPLAASMRTETQRFIEHVLYTGDGTLETLLSANYTFADELLATTIYDDTSITGPEHTRLQTPADQRAGLLTMPSVLAVYARPDQSSPVHRGAFVRERMMCQFLPPPPEDVIVVAPDPDPNATTRERFAEHTENPACAGCHRLTDGIGFGFEGYDAVGRFRTTENGLPIDDSGEVISSVDADGPFNGAVELALRLSKSVQVRDCAATQWFRFALARPETELDACSLEVAKQLCREGRCDLEALINGIVTSDSFRYRAQNALGN